MSRLKRLIVEIHHRSLWQVLLMPPLQEPLGAALAPQCKNKRKLVRGGMATVYLARDLKGAGQVAADLLQPVTAKRQARE
jgi:hypothetical protein